MLATSMVTSAAPVPVAAPAGELIELWPGGAPGGASVTVRERYTERAPQGPLQDRIVEHVTRPAMAWFAPRTAWNGVTLLLVPGGAYERVVLDKEGFESAEWFAAHGFACAALRYRLPADGWAAGPDAPVHDARRALRLLRARVAADGGTQQARFGVIGFSAGGHLVARLITDPGIDYARVDAEDERSGGADFAVLMYPVIATEGDAAHGGSVKQLIAGIAKPTNLSRLAPHGHVGAHTPPTLLIHAADDDAVSVENSLLMYDALRKAGVRSALHVFERGGHGFGLRLVAGKDVAIWPELVRHWALGDSLPR